MWQHYCYGTVTWSLACVCIIDHKFYLSSFPSCKQTTHQHIMLSLTSLTTMLLFHRATPKQKSNDCKLNVFPLWSHLCPVSTWLLWYLEPCIWLCHWHSTHHRVVTPACLMNEWCLMKTVTCHHSVCTHRLYTHSNLWPPACLCTIMIKYLM